MNLNQLFCEMIQYYRNDPKRIQHFTKVHSYAKLIGELSGMQGEELLTLEVAAYVHDIGIKVAEEKYGSSNGRLQEQNGTSHRKSRDDPGDRLHHHASGRHG